LKLARLQPQKISRESNNVQEISMNKLIAAALVSLFAVNVAFAQAAAPAAKPEANPAAAAPAKIDAKAAPAKAEAKTAEAPVAAGSCEEKAVGKNGKKLSGAAKNSFMKKCEKDSQTAAPKSNTTHSAQKQKMSSCSKEGSAKGLKGAEYKAFVSNCLKG
jgi:glucose/arabinose dehydrogenase